LNGRIPAPLVRAIGPYGLYYYYKCSMFIKAATLFCDLFELRELDLLKWINEKSVGRRNLQFDQGKLISLR